ncbi:hypothetical protein N9R79_03325 [Vibrio sp.]|nr:hypothetical protein [Vibrio sp.]
MKKKKFQVDLMKESKFVFSLALFIELGAVLIGLGISGATAMQAMEANANIIAIFIAAAPFVMVALCELSKIPLSLGIWYGKKSKLLYIVFSLFVCFITFETLFNGFERNFANLTFQANRKEIERESYQDMIEINKEKIARIRSEYDDKKAEIEAKFKENEEEFENRLAVQKEDISKSMTSLPAVEKSLQRNRAARSRVMAEKSQVLKELTAKKQAALQQMSESKGSNSAMRAKQIETLENKLADVRKLMDQEVNESFFSTTQEQIREKYMVQINKLQEQINALVSGGLETTGNDGSFGFKALEEQYSLVLSDLDQKIKEYNQTISGLNRRHAQLKKSASNSSVQAEADLEAKMKEKNERVYGDLERLDSTYTDTLNRIEALNEENFNLQLKVKEVNSDITQMYLSNQIYRMAAHVEGTKELDQINPHTVSLVSVIWFGSLALVCSIIGPVLVLLSTHFKYRTMQSRHDQEEFDSRYGYGQQGGGGRNHHFMDPTMNRFR